MELTPTQRKNLVPLVLFLANLIYLYLGGLIFESIEYEPKTKYTTTDDASLFLETLKETSLGKRMLPSDFDSKEVVKGLQTDSLKNLNDKFEKIQNERIIASRPHWSFSNSLFFATTVVTTIGYGNLAPISLGGRMFCIIYALIGIPLTLMLLAVVGNHIVHYLNNACAWLVNRIRAYHSNYEFESADTQINAPVWIALPIIFLFLAIMSSMYCALEGWDFGTALYFIFITFTTIGFGDIVPRSQALALIFQGIWINLMLLYIGLSIVSITINLCAQSLMAQLKKTGLHTKILQLFSTQGDSAEGINARTQQGETADRDQARKSNRRKGKKGERIAMSDLEPRSDGERSGPGREDEEHSTRLKINREADGKHYGTLQE